MKPLKYQLQERLIKDIKEQTRKELIEDIMDWCYKNNTIKTKYPNLNLLTTDGGWVNVLELKKFLEEKK